MAERLYKKLLSIDLLKRAWHLARSDAQNAFLFDSYRYNDFAFHLEENLSAIFEALKNDCYHAKTLLRIDVPKSSLAVRPGSSPEIEDRIVTFAITCLIAPILDKELPDTVYSCRLKTKQERNRLFEDLEILNFPFLKRKTIQGRVSIMEPWYGQWPKFVEETKRAYEIDCYHFLAISDISAYFENINLEILRENILHRYLPKEQKIVNLLCSILQEWVWRSPSGRSLGRGIPQGNTVSSFLGNIYLLPLDMAFQLFARTNDIKYFRYMDDVKIFSKDEETARSSLLLMNERLRDLHLNVQGEKTLILRRQEILREIEDTRLDEVNKLLKQFRGGHIELSNTERKQAKSVLITQYKKIKSRGKTLDTRNLRLFRRILTGFTLIQDSYLVPRTLIELRRNPDYALFRSSSIYFRLFGNLKAVDEYILSTLSTAKGLFELQEAMVLIMARYLKNYSIELKRVVRKIAQSRRKHWYVRCQAILFLAQLELGKNNLKALRKQYNIESNTEIRRAIVAPLCQCEAKELNEFLREIVFDISPKISRLARMLLYLKEKEDRAKETINDIFREFDEIKLMDRFYQLEVIKLSKYPAVMKTLRHKIKSVRRYVRRPVLRKKLERILDYAEQKLQKQQKSLL